MSKGAAIAWLRSSVSSTHLERCRDERQERPLRERRMILGRASPKSTDQLNFQRATLLIIHGGSEGWVVSRFQTLHKRDATARPAASPYLLVLRPRREGQARGRARNAPCLLRVSASPREPFLTRCAARLAASPSLSTVHAWEKSARSRSEGGRRRPSHGSCLSPKCGKASHVPRPRMDSPHA